MEPTQESPKTPNKGDCKRPLQWILIYVIVAIIVYGAIYFIFFHHASSSGGGYSY